MKIILGISLILNLVLIYSLMTQEKKNHKPPLEKIIIETHKNPRLEKLTQTPAFRVGPVPGSQEKQAKETEKNNVEMPDAFAFDSVDVQDAGEKLEFDRMSYLSDKLGLSEEKISEHKRLREEFYKETDSFWKKNPVGEISFSDRRQMIDREEKLHRDLEKLFGKEKWLRYQKYRQDYNQRSFKQQREENRPFLFMGI